LLTFPQKSRFLTKKRSKKKASTIIINLYYFVVANLKAMTWYFFKTLPSGRVGDKKKPRCSTSGLLYVMKIFCLF
jgi:hypothetical protein